MSHWHALSPSLPPRVSDAVTATVSSNRGVLRTFFRNCHRLSALLPPDCQDRQGARSAPADGDSDGQPPVEGSIPRRGQRPQFRGLVDRRTTT